MHKFDSATFLYKRNRKETLSERLTGLGKWYHSDYAGLSGWGTRIVLAILLVMATVVLSKAQEPDVYPTPVEVYLDLDLEHIAALEQSAQAEVTLDSILAVDSNKYICAHAQLCDLNRVEIVIFYDQEHQVYGIMWSDPVVFTLSLAQEFADPEKDFLYTATWTLRVHDLIDHVDPLGSVMAAWVVPYLEEVGHTDPVGYLKQNEIDLAQILAQEVLPLVRQDYFGDVLVAETSGTDKG